MKRFCKILAVSGVISAAMPLAAFAQNEGGRYYHGPGMMWGGGFGSMGGFGMFFGFIFTLLILAVLIIGIVWALRYLGIGSSIGTNSRGGALDILRERYARGEIDSKEFEERRRALSE